ncbi:MAG: endospore germination permease [Clostridia bacterium]|nr:endospore germination permease [Clostridia bacterium]MDD4048575.1 endospore germination permease [Clostridia bacterium]
MKNKVYIGYSEVATLISIMIGTKAFLGYPRLVTQLGMTAGWIIVFFSGLISLCLWLLISSFLACFPKKSLTAITESTFGSIIGTVLNIVVFTFSILVISNSLRIFSEVVIITALTETPVIVLTLVFILAAWIAAYYGIEAISRSAYISFPFIIASVIAVLILLYPYYDFKQITPIWGSGILSIGKNSFLGISAFGEVILLCYIIHYFQFDVKKVKQAGAFSIILVTIFFAAIVIVYQMVLPVPTSIETLVPFYQLSRSINLGHYFQRVESIFVMFWIFTAFLRLSMGLFVSTIIFQDTLKLPYYRPLLPAICLLVFSLSLTPADMMQTVMYEDIKFNYGWLVTFVLPLFILVVALILKRKEE